MSTTWSDDAWERINSILALNSNVRLRPGTRVFLDAWAEIDADAFSEHLTIEQLDPNTTVGRDVLIQCCDEGHVEEKEGEPRRGSPSSFTGGERHAQMVQESPSQKRSVTSWPVSWRLMALRPLDISSNFSLVQVS